MTMSRAGLRTSTLHNAGAVRCRATALGLFFTLGLNVLATAQTTDATLKRETSSIQVAFDAHQPGLSALSIDSLQRGSFRASPIVDRGAPQAEYKVTVGDGWIQYALASDPTHVVWQLRCDGDTLRMRSLYRPNAASLTWTFDPYVSHATLLGHATTAGDIALPALLHLPGMGSLRVYARQGGSNGTTSAGLGYVAHRNQSNYVAITFPAATAAQRWIEYSLQTAAIYPAVPGMDPGDTRFDGFRRDFLDVFQQQAELHLLANHAASDPCPLTVYIYADMARYTPQLVQGLNALDLVRDTLDRYLGGFVGYGMPGYTMYDEKPHPNQPHHEHYPHPSLDTYPSLLIAAYDYADASGDLPWLRQNYKRLRNWSERLMVANADASPLLEYPESGNSGSWTPNVTVRPASWWDTIGYGHQDAYANALGYRALRGMAVLAGRMGETSDAARYRQRADQIHAAYAGAFLDRSAGVLAGWRSSDGQLHNYYFPFVNGIAVRYGLIDGEMARRAMDGILAEMQKVGYTNFALGLPGNLVPIRRADYVDLDAHAGGPTREDGSDGFEIYENGGATACHAYFTIAALYLLGRKEQGDRMLMPMLDALAKQEFSGRGANGQTNDWKDWKGGAHGYEGFLVDNYYTFLAVLDRANLLQKLP
jgi:hypothetical protein